MIHEKVGLFLVGFMNTSAYLTRLSAEATAEGGRGRGGQRVQRKGELSSLRSWPTHEGCACLPVQGHLPGAPEAGGGGHIPVSPGPLEWGVSGMSGMSLGSAALLEVLVLVGSSGACSRVPATPRMPFFPNSFSTSKKHQKNEEQNWQSSAVVC